MSSNVPRIIFVRGRTLPADAVMPPNSGVEELWTSDRSGTGCRVRTCAVRKQTSPAGRARQPVPERSDPRAARTPSGRPKLLSAFVRVPKTANDISFSQYYFETVNNRSPAQGGARASRRQHAPGKHRSRKSSLAAGSCGRDARAPLQAGFRLSEQCWG